MKAYLAIHLIGDAGLIIDDAGIITTATESLPENKGVDWLSDELMNMWLKVEVFSFPSKDGNYYLIPKNKIMYIEIKKEE